MAELKSIKMNRSKIQQRANRIVWNVYLRRTILMSLGGMYTVGAYNLFEFINNL